MVSNTTPTLVPDAEVGADTATPPTLVCNVFSLSEPAPMLFMKAGAETEQSVNPNDTHQPPTLAGS